MILLIVVSQYDFLKPKMLKPFKFLLHSSFVGSLKKLRVMMRKTTNGIHYNKYESCAYLNTQNRLRLTIALHY